MPFLLSQQEPHSIAQQHSVQRRHIQKSRLVCVCVCVSSKEARLSNELRKIKNLPAMQETQVRSLCWEDPLEKGMATHSSVLAWRILWTEEPGRIQSMASQRVGHD